MLRRNNSHLPVQVYLDSSDYSIFGDRKPEHKATFDRLCELVDNARIEVRFSFVHVSEIAQLNDNVKDAASRRATAIQRLTCGKCLKMFDRICIEGAACLFGYTTYPHYAFGDSSDWMPLDKEKYSVNIVQEARKEVDELAMCHDLNRRQRRALKRTISKPGCLLKKPLLSAARQKFPEILNQKLKESSKRKWLTESQIIKSTISTVGDISTLVWALENYDPSKKIPAMIRKFGQGIVMITGQLRNGSQMNYYCLILRKLKRSCED